MSLLSQTKDICEELNLDPVKSKGQNFLIEPKVVNDIVKVTELKKDETVLEVGPGLGVLTQELVKAVCRVVAVELDKKLFEYLKSKFKTTNNLELIEGDILELLNDQIVKLLGNNYKVVANLPYQITSHILRRLLELENKPSELVVMVQKEVAERICAPAGKMSVLAVMVQYYSQSEIIRMVNKNNFWPIPQVDSAVIKLKVKIERANNINDKEFFKLVKIGFSSKRKMLKNNLSNVYDSQQVTKVLKKLGLNLAVRAQELRVEEWIGLYKKMVNDK